MGKTGNVGLSKYRVLQIIAENEPDGISVGELAHKMDCHRETAGLYCMQLRNERLVLRKGKHGKYHLTDRARGYPALLAFSIGNTGLNQILDWNMLSTRNKFCNHKIVNELLTKYKDKKSTGINLRYLFGNEKINELVLFELANRIGAFIIHFLIYSMKPNKIVGYTKLKADLDIKGNDDIAIRWIENAIKPGRILDEFTKIPIVQSGIIMNNKKSESDDRYIVDTVYWKELIQAFSRLYPEIFKDLEKIHSESLESIDVYDMKGRIRK